MGRTGRQPGAGVEKASGEREPAELSDRFSNRGSLETVTPRGRKNSSPGGDGRLGIVGKRGAPMSQSPGQKEAEGQSKVGRSHLG